MSENIETTSETVELEDNAEQPIEPVEGASDASDTEKEPRSSEAKKYRLRLRETEAERDTLRDSLTQARQQILDRELDPALRNLIKLANRDVASLFTDDGTLDEGVLEKTAAELNVEYPNMLSIEKGTWQGLDEPVKLSLFRKTGKGAVAPYDIDEQQPSGERQLGNKWQGAFAPQQ